MSFAAAKFGGIKYPFTNRGTIEKAEAALHVFISFLTDLNFLE